MSYTLKLTNGKILLTLPDQQSDRVSTSLTLIGKNVNAYGTDINQNYIRILENFANNVAPTSPLVGQLWYDTNSQQIKVFTKNNQFKVVGSPIISPTKPITLTTGDLWYDTKSDQLKFQKDASTLVVIGPPLDSSAGKSGWVSEAYLDSDNTTQTVVSLYSNDTLLGILTDKEFTIKAGTTSTSGLFDLKEGFNAVSTGTLETAWWGLADKANYLVNTSTGELVSTNEILVATDPIFTYNTFTAYSDVIFGTDNDFQFTTTVNISEVHTDATMSIGGYNQSFNFYVNSAYIKPPAIHVNGVTNRVGFFNNDPQFDVDLSGNMRISGNLFVNGETSYVTATDLIVTDKTITLGQTDNPTDETATGGGIILRSGVNNNKEIIWFNSALDNIFTGTPNTWSVTDNLELREIDSSLYIYGRQVLSRDTLHESIEFAPGLTQVGNLSSATIGTLRIEPIGAYETRIGSAVSSSTIVIGDVFTTAIDFSGRRLINVATPSIADTSTYKNSVATVGWFEDYITISRNPILSTTIDVTGIAEEATASALDEFVIAMLTRLWNPEDPEIVYRAPNNGRARVIVTRYTVPAMVGVPSNYLVPGVAVKVDQNGVFSSVDAIQWSSLLRVETNIPANTLTIYRAVKEYIVAGGVWTFIGDGGADNLVWTDGNW